MLRVAPQTHYTPEYITPQKIVFIVVTLYIWIIPLEFYSRGN